MKLEVDVEFSLLAWNCSVPLYFPTAPFPHTPTSAVFRNKLSMLLYTSAQVTILHSSLGLDAGGLDARDLKALRTVEGAAIIGARELVLSLA